MESNVAGAARLGNINEHVGVSRVLHSYRVLRNSIALGAWPRLRDSLNAQKPFCAEY